MSRGELNHSEEMLELHREVLSPRFNDPGGLGRNKACANRHNYLLDNPDAWEVYHSTMGDILKKGGVSYEQEDR